MAAPSSELASVAGANLIDGHWQQGAGAGGFDVLNPSTPSDVLASVQACDDSDVDAAVGAAAAAAAAWRSTPAAVRGAILTRAAAIIDSDVEAIAALMSREMGKPLREARGETARAAAILRYYGGECWRPVGQLYEQSTTGAPVYTLRRPLGVVALITPWNFPLAIPTWKLAPALAYGNAVVLKLAQPASLTGLALARALDAAGLHAGVLNVLLGSGSMVGPRLTSHPDVAAISFTGSEATGLGVRDAATHNGKRMQLELDGQNPLIVMADADIERAAAAACAGAFWSAGQKCTATRRILIQDGAYDRFAQALLAAASAAKVGDASDPETEVGPIVSEDQLSEVLEGVERGRGEGATLLAGGERQQRPGWFLPPTIFESAGSEAFLSREEIFGPVTTLYRFDSLEEALALANSVRFGLSASIFTSGLAAAREFVGGVAAGIVHVNSQTAGADVHVPFGGVKSSGFGPHEQGQAAAEFYTEQITVYEDT
jgi:aldehyde dehydrogenase (NAD+)